MRRRHFSCAPPSSPVVPCVPHSIVAAEHDTSCYIVEVLRVDYLTREEICRKFQTKDVEFITLPPTRWKQSGKGHGNIYLSWNMKAYLPSCTFTLLYHWLDCVSQASLRGHGRRSGGSPQGIYRRDELQVKAVEGPQARRGRFEGMLAPRLLGVDVRCSGKRKLDFVLATTVSNLASFRGISRPACDTLR